MIPRLAKEYVANQQKMLQSVEWFSIFLKKKFNKLQLVKRNSHNNILTFNIQHSTVNIQHGIVHCLTVIDPKSCNILYHCYRACAIARSLAKRMSASNLR